MSRITPRVLGYRMPAEWEQQDAIWLSWPHNEVTWPDGMLSDVERTYVEIIAALHPDQKIKLLVRNADAEASVRGMLKRAGVALPQVIFFQIPTEDSWIRDYGPTFVVNNSARDLAMVKWTFNAWGNKYEDLIADNKIPYELNRRLSLRMFEPGIVLEGGSIEVNGAGAVLTTEQCLLNKNRNPKLSREERTAIPMMIAMYFPPEPHYHDYCRQQRGEDIDARLRREVATMRALWSEMARIGPMLRDS